MSFSAQSSWPRGACHAPKNSLSRRGQGPPRHCGTLGWGSWVGTTHTGQCHLLCARVRVAGWPRDSLGPGFAPQRLVMLQGSPVGAGSVVSLPQIPRSHPAPPAPGTRGMPKAQPCRLRTSQRFYKPLEGNNCKARGDSPPVNTDRGARGEAGMRPQCLHPQRDPLSLNTTNNAKPAPGCGRAHPHHLRRESPLNPAHVGL